MILSLEGLRIKTKKSFVIRRIPLGRDTDEQRRASLETLDLSSPETLGLICI